MAMAKPLNPCAKEWKPKEHFFPNNFVTTILSQSPPPPPPLQISHPFFSHLPNEIFGLKEPQDLVIYYYFPFQTPTTTATATFFFLPPPPPPPQPSFEIKDYGEDESALLKEGEKVLKEILKINEDGKKTSFSRNLPPRLRDGRSCSRSVCKSWRTNSVNSDFSSSTPPLLACSNSNYTTVMIKNIPNQYRRKDFMEFLDGLCRDHHLAYDFFYLPMDFRRHDNLGFAFVNLTTSSAALTVCQVLQGYEWNFFHTRRGHFASKKVCEIAWAHIQGKDALVEHFEKSCFVCDNKAYLPVVLSPARNGFNVLSSKMRNVGRILQREYKH